MGPEFFQTGMGRKFYEADVPELIKAINRLAAAVEKSNSLAEDGKKDIASPESSDRCE